KITLALRKSALAGKLERFNRSAPRARRVTVRHHINRNICLFRSLDGHTRANLFDEPALEFRACLQSSATNDQGVWIEGIYHLVEEKYQAIGLHPEDFTAERIAFIGQSAH